jgi:excisionase family DNA binding protein
MTHKDQHREIPQALKLYTVAETAAILSVSKKSVYNWIKQAALPAIRLGPGQRYLRIRQTDLERFIAKRDFE